ncbi:Calcitonin gene-related peptide type 1 receptor [Penaeus vannamei]|uniref:Calcitonin gene-related peptide type 1 receptor n=1 Tax=Penaeus vannamei TaxID=6689 RepID=A0A423TJ78_PENVA|nr:Calcitonin gene-related peptide type 1 receptor [Penaeus vannamei]
MWMFCEAFYLHKLVASAFAEQRSLFVYYAIGWGFPINPVILYASFRASHANDQCWVVPADPYEWILNIPCLIALLLNLVFMINILRVLVTKLRAANTHEPSQYR